MVQSCVELRVYIYMTVSWPGVQLDLEINLSIQFLYSIHAFLQPTQHQNSNKKEYRQEAGWFGRYLFSSIFSQGTSKIDFSLSSSLLETLRLLLHYCDCFQVKCEWWWWWIWSFLFYTLMNDMVRRGFMLWGRWSWVSTFEMGIGYLTHCPRRNA